MSASNRIALNRIALIGPGAIGCVVAAALSERHEPVICTRTPFPYVSVRRSGCEPVRHSVRCETEPSSVGPCEFVFLATKAHQVDAVAEWLEQLVEAHTITVVLQNGIDHRERVAPYVGTARTVPVIIDCSARRHDPGCVEITRTPRFQVPHDRAARAVADLLRGTFISVETVEDWTTAAWTKLLSNAAHGAICTLTRQSQAVLGDPGAGQLALAVMAEIIEVGRAEGATWPDGIAAQVLRRTRDRGGSHIPSIAVDRLAGRPTEWRARNGVVVRLADKHGIDVPLNRALTTLMRLGEPSPKLP